MDFFDQLHGSDGEDSSSISLRDLPLDTYDAASHHLPNTLPSDVSDFSFPVLPKGAEIQTASTDSDLHRHLLLRIFASKPKLCPFALRRAESLDGNYPRRRRDVQTGGYQLLRRARSDPRPTPAGQKCKKWPLLVMGLRKFPAEMEIEDIRNRQMRNTPPAAGNHNAHISCWTILRALSCKAAEKTAVTPLRATGRAREKLAVEVHSFCDMDKDEGTIGFCFARNEQSLEQSSLVIAAGTWKR